MPGGAAPMCASSLPGRAVAADLRAGRPESSTTTATCLPVGSSFAYEVNQV